MFSFHVVAGSDVKKILDANPAQTIADVKSAYLAHHDKETVNPDSYFLRFPKNERNRIIALPASVDGDINVCGLKWIGSFPENIHKNLPRASAVLILNDQQTGYPYACLEASQISAARTAASAVLGAYWLNQQQRKCASLSIIGAGIIARNILEMFVADQWEIGKISIFDIHRQSAEILREKAASVSAAPVTIDNSLEQALRTDIVVFATNVGTPYVADVNSFKPGQIVLNISLRDIDPELILRAENIFDDVEHCMKANTSPHLAEQISGGRAFVSGTLAQLMHGEISLDRSKPLIFSPFGLGVLDLVIGKKIFDIACDQKLVTEVANFFAETVR